VEAAGLKGYDMTWWQGVFAPSGTPPDVLAKLARAVKKVTEDPSVKTTMFDAGFVPAYVPPVELTSRMQRDMAIFKKIATDAKLDIE